MNSVEKPNGTFIENRREYNFSSSKKKIKSKIISVTYHYKFASEGSK